MENKNFGAYIALFGADGAGKSTVANAIEELCTSRGIGTCRYHWRPQILPRLRKATRSTDPVSPFRGQSRSRLASIALYLYYFIDFMIGYYIRIRGEISNGYLILHERYYYDVIFDPERYRLRPLRRLAKFLALLVPQPHLIVVLQGDPMVIAERKGELTAGEVRSQQAEMIETLVLYGSLCKVDVTLNSPEDIAHLILQTAVEMIDRHHPERKE